MKKILSFLNQLAAWRLSEYKSKGRQQRFLHKKLPNKKLLVISTSNDYASNVYSDVVLDKEWKTTESKIHASKSQ